jgi:squalene-hopene/tetraprenyl-beta-curcumene cyclase
LPYALARPVLRAALAEDGPTANERKLLDDVTKRVRLWKEIEPFYPDQTRGIPKTSESRGTEAILNALILASRDARSGVLGDDAQQAFDNLWALQMKTGELSGAWAWLNFRYEPWESADGPYYGATLAAIAVGSAPNGYASNAGIQDGLKMLRAFLQRGSESQNLFNRIMLLWASTRLPGLLTPEQQRSIIDASLATQQSDGGWTLSSLGRWTRRDGTALDARSDGYATGLITFVLQQAGMSRVEPPVNKGLTWLARNQERTSGAWPGYSLNKEREPSSDAAQFMRDAATSFAVLALTSQK